MVVEGYLWWRSRSFFDVDWLTGLKLHMFIGQTFEWDEVRPVTDSGYGKLKFSIIKQRALNGGRDTSYKYLHLGMEESIKQKALSLELECWEKKIGRQIRGAIFGDILWVLFGYLFILGFTYFIVGIIVR